MLHMSFDCGGYIGCRHMQRLRREGQARAARRVCCAAGRYALWHSTAIRRGRLAAVELGGVPRKRHRGVHDSAGGQYYYLFGGLTQKAERHTGRSLQKHEGRQGTK